MTRPPRVTVLTPTFNRPAYLAAAIRSVVAQELCDWEMLVINDGGVDVRGVVEEAGDARVRYFAMPENRGKAACLNFGLARARADYIAYLDDDDAWYPNHLATLVRALDENPQVGAAYSDLYAVAVLNGRNGRRIPLEKRVCVSRDFNRLLMFHFNHTLHVSLMHRKEPALRAGGYDEDVRVMVDWNLTRKLCFYTDFLHVPAATGEYYQPVTGSDRISDLQRKDRESYLHNLRRIRADLPPEPWPHVRKVAVVHPVRRWDEQALARVRYFADRLDYPCRIVLVNREPGAGLERCRSALGPLAGLKHVYVADAPPGASLHEAYLSGARVWAADFYYLPSEALSLDVDLRLIRGVAHLEEGGHQALCWPQDRAPGPYDALVSSRLLFGAAPESWPAPVPVPDGWMPAALRTDYFLSLAEHCQREGDYRAAEQVLRQAGAVREGGTGDAYLAQLMAHVAFGRGRYAKAERMCRRLIAAGYGADNYVRLGRLLQRRGRFAEAEQAYALGLQAIGLTEADVEGPEFPLACAAAFDAFEAMVGRGECMMELGRDAEAGRALRLACRLRTDAARPYVAFGRLLAGHGQLPEAEAAFRMALDRRREADDAAVEAGMAEVCERTGRTEEAFEWYCAGLRRRPCDADLLSGAERAGAALGRSRELAELYEAFLGHRPGHVPALQGLARIYRLLGRAEEAAALAERAQVLAGARDTSAA